MRVYEARPWVGGRMRTDVVDGFRIDTATQLFGSMYAELFRLLREVGAGHLAVRTAGRDAIWRGGRAHEIVYGSATSMLASSAVPLGTKMRMGAKYLPFLTQHSRQLDMHALERAVSLDRESVAAWGERELGPEFVRTLAFPLLAAGYGGTPEQTSAVLYHLMARYGMGVEVHALRGGAGGFCKALTARLREGGTEVLTSTPVARVSLTGSAVEVAAEGEGGEAGGERFDGVVLALPAPLARVLLPETAHALRAWLEGVRFRPHVTVALLLDRPLRVPYFGLSFPAGETETAAVASVQENKEPQLVPPGKGLLVIFANPARASRLLEAEPRAVVDAMLPELERAFPDLASSILRAKLYRWPEGVALFYPGYLEHLQRFRTGAIEDDLPLVLAGDYLHAPTVEGAVVSGARGAERLLRRLRVEGRPGGPGDPHHP